MVLDWLLRVGIDKEQFSLREVIKDRKISLGLVQKVFEILRLNGLLHTKGVRTSKRFFMKEPRRLLKSWQEQYSIVKKCKMWTYQSGLGERSYILRKLTKSNLNQQVALALHSAAETYECKNTNLNTLELYMLDSTIRTKLEDLLQLVPQEKGYEVLLIEPYYKSLLSLDEKKKSIKISPALLTFLDLYHFPLRGLEQAEFMAERIPEIKRIYKGKS